MNQSPSGERDIRKGDGESSRRATEDLLRAIVFMQLYNKARNNSRDKTKGEDKKEREIALPDSDTAVDVSFEDSPERLAIPPGSPAFQLSGHDDTVRLEGIDPPKLAPGSDGVGVFSAQPAPYSRDSIQLGGDRADINISVRVDGASVRGSQETIGLAIDEGLTTEQKEQLAKAINNESVDKEVVVFAQDKNNPANKIGFVRSPDVDRGWIVQNDSDQYQMTSEQASAELQRMKSQEASEMRGVIRDAVKADSLFIDGHRYHVHAMDEHILVTDKQGRPISGEEYERVAQSASNLSKSKGLDSNENGVNKRSQKQRGKQLEP